MPIQKMRRFLSAAGVFFSSFMATAIAILAVLLLMGKLLGFHLFTIESASMAPRYPVGTLIIVQNVRAEKISAGDVITYVFNEEGTRKSGKHRSKPAGNLRVGGSLRAAGTKTAMYGHDVFPRAGGCIPAAYKKSGSFFR